MEGASILSSTFFDGGPPRCSAAAPAAPPPAPAAAEMPRVQLAFNVGDLDAAVAFYSKLFGTEPAKRRPGYANFAVAEPPLKLVLLEADAAGVGADGAHGAGE